MARANTHRRGVPRRNRRSRQGGPRRRNILRALERAGLISLSKGQHKKTGAHWLVDEAPS